VNELRAVDDVVNCAVDFGLDGAVLSLQVDEGNRH
jgi:hypothetical protein